METIKLNKLINSQKKPVIQPMYGKIPPQNKEAESAVLSQLINGSGRLIEVMEILKSGECFYLDAHQRIYDAILTMNGKGQKVDLVGVTTELSNSGNLELIGGGYFLTKLSDKTVFDHTILSHAEDILECYKRRESIKVAGELMALSYENGESLNDIVHAADQELIRIISEGDISEAKPIRDLIIPFMENLQAAKENKKDITGVNTGYSWLNDKTGGWQNTDLIILAARPSVGKTAFALNLALNATVGEDPVPVAIFSLEMGADQLMKRVVSALSLIELEKITKGQLSDIETSHIDQTLNIIASKNIHIDETFGVSITQLRARAKRLKRKHNIGLLIIDYLQLMAGETKGGNREQEISKISRGLKGIAKELDIPVIALSQMSRDVEKRSDKEPMLSDLRESGAIEQDADIVMFIHHPKDAESGQIKNVIKIAKHRNGSLGDMEECKFFGNIQKWMNPSEANAYMGRNTTFKPFAGMPTSSPDERIEGKKMQAFDDAPF
ncbi:replicative DNA helicase [Taibaiella lutea]|uniref:Replicative DNA helicase n=1 Tax=Taibaiella lutea TaxID=2608001 RepID=A0A5M6CFI5_9BACT|nr:replicative DNA helicase [Taibaiella lutea]KAA5532682.1 replicative DNA helicase [Taibaiella lutea]